MKIRIFDQPTHTELICINDPSSEAYITGTIQGLGLPGVRMSTGASSGQHGGYSGTPHFEPRVLSIDGLIKDDAVAQAQARRRAWSSAFSGLGQLEARIEYPESGQAFLIFCKLYGSPSLDYTPLDPLKHNFTIDLLADDPLIYDDITGAANEAVIPKAVGGGAAWPMDWPVESEAGSGPVTVTNTGDQPIYPTFTVTGSMTNPVIENITTGRKLQFNSFNAPVGSELFIDMYPSRRLATLNGGNVLYALTTPPGWFALLPGDNTIQLTTGDSADTASALMQWRNGFMGI